MEKLFLKFKKIFDSRNNLRRVSINSSLLLIEQVIRLVTGFFVSIVTMRYLGPDGLGILSYANSWVLMFSSFAYLGLDSIVIKKLIEKKDDSGVILGSALILKFLGSLLTVVLSVSLLFAFGHNDSQTIFLVLIISLGYLFLPTGVVDFYYQSKLKAKYTASIRTLTYLTITLLKFLCIIFKANIYFFGSLVALEMVFNGIGYWIFFFKKEKIKVSFDRLEIKNLLLSALPIFLSTLVVGIYSKIDQILIGSIINTKTLGYYSLVISLIQMFYFIPSVVISSVFPILIEEKNNLNFVSYEKKIWKTLKYLSVLGIILIVFINMFSSMLIKLLYGEQFYSSVGLLKVYTWNLLPVFASSILSYWLVIENKQKLMLYFQLFASIVGVVTNFLLITKFGVYGAAYATLFVNILLFILNFVFLKKILNIFFKIVRPPNWKEIEYFDDIWKARIKLMSDYILEGESVSDLGSGRMWLREYLDDSNKYYSVDYKKRDFNTIVCDFNKGEFPKIDTDVAFVSGCLEYVKDPEWFVRKMAENYKKCILSYCVTDDISSTLTRRGLSWVNNFSEKDIVKLFKKNNMDLVIENRSILNNRIFVFKKNE